MTRKATLPHVVLDDGTTFSGLAGCRLVYLTEDEAEEACDDSGRLLEAIANGSRTIDLEAVPEMLEALQGALDVINALIPGPHKTIRAAIAKATGVQP